MSHSDDKRSSTRSNIVDLDAGKRPRRSGVANLLAQCRTMTVVAVGKRLRAMFENVDDALFDLAEKATSNQAQNIFFDGMREVRRKRPRMERKFGDIFGEVFDQLATGEELDQQGRAVDDNDHETGGLSLVDDNVLEESLAIDSMVSKAESRYSRDLHALNQRMSVIAGGREMKASENPVGPRAICVAFDRSCEPLELEVQVKLILFKLFERYVLSQIGELYTQINRQLVEAGVLPQLKAGVRRQGRPKRRRPSAQRSASDDDGGARHAGPQDYADDSGAGDFGSGGYEDDDYGGNVEHELLSTLTQLLAQRRGGGGMHGASHSASGSGSRTFYEPSVLINALSLLQGEHAQTQPRSGAAGGGPVHPDIKKSLMDQVEGLTGKDDANMKGQDEDAIDLVAMLFRFILEDRNLPDTVQAQLARLQIPYLKVALVDRHFFAQKSHPARRLLDQLAELGMSWSESVDRDSAVISKIRDVVQRVVDDFQEDITIFRELFGELQEFASTQGRRSRAAEKRTTEATKGREKLLDARKRAAREILDRIEDEKLPPVAQQLLTKPWANVLVLTLLRNGDDDRRWTDALQVVDDLVWSCRPKSDNDDLEDLRALRPQLVEALREGLELVAYHQDDIDRLMGELEQVHKSILAGNTPAVETASPSLAADAEAAESDFVAREAKAKAEPSAPELPDEKLDQLDSLEKGVWIEFHHEDQVLRAKLSWISPISGRYLFVNSKGLKVADMSPREIVQRMEANSLAILDQAPLMDRALGAIVDKLKNETDTEAETDTKTGSSSTTAPPAHKPGSKVPEKPQQGPATSPSSEATGDGASRPKPDAKATKPSSGS